MLLVPDAGTELRVIVDIPSRNRCSVLNPMHRCVDGNANRTLLFHDAGEAGGGEAGGERRVAERRVAERRVAERRVAERRAAERRATEQQEEKEDLEEREEMQDGSMAE